MRVDDSNVHFPVVLLRFGFCNREQPLRGVQTNRSAIGSVEWHLVGCPARGGL